MHLLHLQIPYPFRCACREPNAIVIKPTEGDFLNNYANSSNLHIGITDSKGNVYEYDYSGISQNNGDSWSQCFPIKIFNSKSSCLPSEWDKTLDNMQMQKCWSAESLDQGPLPHHRPLACAGSAAAPVLSYPLLLVGGVHVLHTRMLTHIHSHMPTCIHAGTMKKATIVTVLF
ncbi:MKRN2 opposite strand protein-like isoform X3 [Uloborus diversus]|uniref:MKRN2 opposite strand protein-like isoform X3 n=1 Tax=Uloborus diversus TaxID=327109 RepID=UPI002409BFAE|nr:MKRN2 opposite strand protein-like isoform X3 [Uloborus diversus]